MKLPAQMEPVLQKIADGFCYGFGFALAYIGLANVVAWLFKLSRP